MIGDLSSNVHEWTEKKLKLSSILNENVKSALVRNNFVSIKDMDSPTSFFFNLERKSVQVNQMYNLKNDNGQCTSEPVEMRRLAVKFYSQLYSPEE